MVVTFTFRCRAADALAPACAAVAALAVTLVLAAARALAIVVLLRVVVVAALVAGVRDTAVVALGVAALLAVAALADDAFGLPHGPRRVTCVQVFGCSNPQAL